MAEQYNFKDEKGWHFPAWAALLISIMANLPVIDMVFHRVKEVGAESHVQVRHLPEFAFPGLLVQLLITFLFGYLLMRYLRNHQWNSEINKGFQWTVLWVVSGQFAIFFIMMSALILFTIHEVSWIISSVATRGLLVLISSVFLTNYMKIQSNREKIFHENEALKESNLQNQIEVLRNQLNPHFFFNTLNTLSYLISQDQAKSQLYLNKLSYVLRSSIELQQSDLILLTEEIKLAEAYFHLLSIRFGGNVMLDIHADDAGHYKVPPMTLQMLIENAIKHNVISTGQPLRIEIALDKENKSLTISNNLQPKVDARGAGIGLKNLDERFRMLAGRSPEIFSKDGKFTVVMPLIPAG
ncbi:MAG: histidine kinase [Bacteroidetes bacterium]|nr:histidine kinase [Bacteroidota bacterium]